MGVPRLAPFIRNSFPKAVRLFRRGEYRTRVDNVYVDKYSIGNRMINLTDLYRTLWYSKS